MSAIVLRPSGVRILVLLALTAIAVVLRLHRLDEWSLWIDEVLSLERARDLGAAGPSWWTPSYGAMAVALRTSGANAWGARLAPALVGALTVPVVFLLFRRHAGAGPALVAAAFLAIAPWHLFWSQNARPYTVLLLVYTVASCALLEGVRSRRIWLSGAAALLLLASVFERRYVLAFVPATFGLWLLLDRWTADRRGSPRAVVVGFLLLVIGALLALVAWDAVAEAAGRAKVIEEIQAFAARGPRRSPQRLLAGVASAATWPLCVLAALAGLEALWHRRASRMFALAATVAPLAVLLVLTSFARAFERYVLVILPWLTLLAAYWISDRWQRGGLVPRLLAVAAAVVVVAAALIGDRDHFDLHGRRANWRGGIEVIAAGWRPGEIVWFHRPAVARYYLGGKGRHRDLDDLDDPRELRDTRCRTWVLVPDRRGFDALRSFLEREAASLEISSVPHLPARLFVLHPRREIRFPSGASPDSGDPPRAPGPRARAPLGMAPR